MIIKRFVLSRFFVVFLYHPYRYFKLAKKFHTLNKKVRNITYNYAIKQKTTIISICLINKNLNELLVHFSDEKRLQQHYLFLYMDRQSIECNKEYWQKYRVPAHYCLYLLHLLTFLESL